MTCRALVELVSDYLDGALDGVTHGRFEAHVAACPGCDTYLAQFRAVRVAAGSLQEEHLSERARSLLVEAFRDWNALP